MKLSIIVLASGNSKRFRENKLLYEIDEKPMYLHTVEKLINLKKKYEYIDFYCHGFDTEYVRQAGMIELVENDTNIIPNYFAPYVAENIDIWVGTPKGRAMFFKADGDQDRPN